MAQNKNLKRFSKIIVVEETNEIIKDDLKNIISEKLSWVKFKNKNILITGANGF